MSTSWQAYLQTLQAGQLIIGDSELPQTWQAVQLTEGCQLVVAQVQATQGSRRDLGRSQRGQVVACKLQGVQVWHERHVWEVGDMIVREKQAPACAKIWILNLWLVQT